MAASAVSKQPALDSIPLEETPELIRVIQEYFECDDLVKANKEKLKIAARLKKNRKDAKDKVVGMLPPIGSEPQTFKLTDMVTISVQPGGDVVESSRVSKPRIVIKRNEPKAK